MSTYDKISEKSQKNIIPIFFATDDNYAPYLVVTLQSIVDHANPANQYKIYIMATTLSLRNINEINKFNNDNFTIEFVDVTDKLDGFGDKLHLRDYYTKTIYFRLFIPSIAREYSKALYLDCDIIVLEDVANLYNHNVDSYLVGVIMEDVMNNYDVFGTYSEKALGIDRREYFNSGVLLMNLDRMRKEKLEEAFFEMLHNFEFKVAPDQDYLNVLCKGKTLWIEQGWNIAPIPGTELPEDLLHLIHYKIAFKPWNYTGVMYEDYFWQTCEKTAYYNELLALRDNYSDESKAVDKLAFDNLVARATRDTNDINNYHNTTQRQKSEQEAKIAYEFAATKI